MACCSCTYRQIAVAVIVSQHELQFYCFCPSVVLLVDTLSLLTLLVIAQSVASLASD